jgi:hypothetical protein
MQWEVEGTHAATGQERSIVVNADDAVQARRLGVRRGWTVESVHPVDAPAAPRSVPPPSKLATATTARVNGSPTPTVAVAPAVEQIAEPTAVRVAAATRTLDRAAMAIGLCGGVFVFTGVLLAGLAAAVSTATRPLGPLVSGLAAGLPVVAAGVSQLVTAVLVRLLATTCGAGRTGRV